MTEPVEVAASEADLISLSRALVAPGAQDVWPLLARGRKLPPAIGPACARLVEEALRHAWIALWRRHGTRVGTSPTGQRGRGWERNAPAPLEFSPATLRFLRWLIATPLGAPTSTIDPLKADMPLAIGDQVVIYLALELTAGTPAQARIAMQPFLRKAPLAHLAFPHLMTLGRPSFEPLVTGPGAVVVEALGPALARSYHEMELAKRALKDPTDVIALGTSQQTALEGFLDACDAARRRDLASFVIDAAARLVARETPPYPQLDTQATLAVRAHARQAAGALLRAAMRWAEWDQQHRGVRFIDDDYAAAQVLLGRFERLGSRGVETIRAWLAELSALAPTASPPQATVENP